MRIGGGLVHQQSLQKVLPPSNQRGTTQGAFVKAPALFGLPLIAAAMILLSACNRPDWFFGTGGKYNEAEIEMLRGRAANYDKAIASLQFVVQENPTYRDSLTLLGKAYYRKGRYRDAYLIIQRALAVNKDDEIAWLVYGLAQMRVGEPAKGLETIKGGLTLLAKAMGDDYRGWAGWDPRGTVRSSLNRAVFQALKGIEERDTLVQATEQLLARIDEEEWYQRQGDRIERSMEGSEGS